MKPKVKKLFNEYHHYNALYKDSNREYHQTLAYRRLYKIIAEIRAL